MPRAMPRNFSCSRSEEHTSELQSRQYLVCRLLLEKKKVERFAARSERQHAELPERSPLVDSAARHLHLAARPGARQRTAGRERCDRPYECAIGAQGRGAAAAL